MTGVVSCQRGTPGVYIISIAYDGNTAHYMLMQTQVPLPSKITRNVLTPRCGVQAAVTLDWLEKHSEVTVTAPVRL